MLLDIIVLVYFGCLQHQQNVTRRSYSVKLLPENEVRKIKGQWSIRCAGRAGDGILSWHPKHRSLLHRQRWQAWRVWTNSCLGIQITYSLHCEVMGHDEFWKDCCGLGWILPCSCEEALWKSQKIASEMMYEFPKGSRKWLYEKCHLLESLKYTKISATFIYRRFSLDLSCISSGSSTWITYPSDPRYPFKLRNAGCIPAEGGCYIPVGPCTCVNLPLGKHDAKIVGEKPWQMDPKNTKKNKKCWNLKHFGRRVGSWPVKGKRPFNLDLLRAWSCKLTRSVASHT